MTLLRNTVLMMAVLILGGCSVFQSYSEVDALNEAQAVGSPFTQALADEYRTFSNEQLDGMFDYPDALHFARKGLAAASGNVVMPEATSDWSLSEYHLYELEAARGRLLVAFDLGAREMFPALAARSQLKFDCWIEAQEENWKNENILDCQNEFMLAMAELESGLATTQEIQDEGTDAAANEGGTSAAEEVLAFDVKPAEPMVPENAVYLVFFNWDSTELGAGARNVLAAVADEVSSNPPSAINVVGHTDTSGAADYNKKLAFKRANAVRDALIANGVDAALLSVDAQGEEELLVETPDNVREPANRRVNISFE